MAKDKKSFTAYCDWKTTFDALPDEKAGQLIKHLFSYINDEEPECNDILINVAFSQIKATLKRDLKKWEAKREQNRLNAKKRWDANAYERIKKDANHAVSVSDSVNVSVNDNIDIRKNKFFQSINELEYPLEVKNEFFDYWTEKKPKGKKMRFELEKTFDVNLRLKRWVKNSERWKKEKSSDKKEKRSAAEIIQEKHGIKN